MGSPHRNAVSERPVKHRASVGPDAARSTYAMFPQGQFPVNVQGWDGWPVNWDTPNWGTGTGQFGFNRDDPNGYLSRVSTVFTCIDLNSTQLASFEPYGLDVTDPEAPERERLPSWRDTPEPDLYAGTEFG